MFKNIEEGCFWVRKNTKATIVCEQTVTSRIKTAGKKYVVYARQSESTYFVQQIQNDLIN